MPLQRWHWTETHVDAVIDDLGENPDVQKKALLFFATTLDIGFCGEKTIDKLYEISINSIPKLLALDVKTLLSSKIGLAEKGATKLVNAITTAKEKATIVQYAVGSGIFGRGIGPKRTELAFKVVPKNLEADATLVANISAQPGWTRDSAQEFVSKLPEFKRFMIELEIKPKVASPPKIVAEGKLKGQLLLFTGFHPKDLEARVQAAGAELADSFTKKVTMLVIKDDTVTNEKTKKAEKEKITILTAEQLTAFLNQ
jgi:NAD-dependent DNA ligase